MNLNAKVASPSPRWHLDEMVCSVGGKRMYLWRAVDDEGLILEMWMRPYRDILTAQRFLAKLLLSYKQIPERIVTDGLHAYRGGAKRLRVSRVHVKGRLRENNRAENLHLPIRRRERKMQKFKSQQSAQRFLDTYSAVYNIFYTQRHLTSRKVLRELRGNAFAAWNEATAA